MTFHLSLMKGHRKRVGEIGHLQKQSYYALVSLTDSLMWLNTFTIINKNYPSQNGKSYPPSSKMCLEQV